jgi:hypothetical protein
MEKSVFCQVRDLSPEKRRAAETLLERSLGEDEFFLIKTSRGRILKHAATGEAYDEAFRQFLALGDELARRAEGMPDSEIDAAIDEAVDYVRHERK